MENLFYRTGAITIYIFFTILCIALISSFVLFIMAMISRQPYIDIVYANRVYRKLDYGNKVKMAKKLRELRDEFSV